MEYLINKILNYDYTIQMAPSFDGNVVLRAYCVEKNIELTYGVRTKEETINEGLEKVLEKIIKEELK